jgi:hypothetical protein
MIHRYSVLSGNVSCLVDYSTSYSPWESHGNSVEKARRLVISRICKVRLPTPVMNVNEQSLTFIQRCRLHGGRETIFVVRDINCYLGIFTRTPHIWSVTVRFFRIIHSYPTTTYLDYALLSSKYNALQIPQPLSCRQGQRRSPRTL